MIAAGVQKSDPPPTKKKSAPVTRPPNCRLSYPRSKYRQKSGHQTRRRVTLGGLGAWSPRVGQASEDHAPLRHRTPAPHGSFVIFGAQSCGMHGICDCVGQVGEAGLDGTGTGHFDQVPLCV